MGGKARSLMDRHICGGGEGGGRQGEREREGDDF